MSLFFWISVLLGIVILFIQNILIKSPEQKERYKDLLNNLFMVIATTIGVVLALYFTDKDSDREKRERTKNVLLLTYKSIENYYASINIMYTNADTNANWRKIWDLNGRHQDIPALKAYDIFYTLTPYTYSDLISMDASVTIALKAIETNDTISNVVFKRMMAAVNCYLRLAGRHILWEIDYQDGKLSENSLHKMINKHHLELNDSLRSIGFPLQ